MTPLVGLLRGRDDLEQVILLMFHYAITFYYFIDIRCYISWETRSRMLSMTSVTNVTSVTRVTNVTKS